MKCWNAALIGLLLGVASAQETNFDITKALARINQELLTGTFRARTEVSVLDGAKDGSIKRTEQIEEFHDAKNGVHSLKHSPSGDLAFFYEKLSKQQYVRYAANDDKCTLLTPEEATKEPTNLLSKYIDTKSKQTQYFLGPSALIKEIPTADITIELAQPSTVRGIKAVGFVITAEIDKQPVIYEIFFPVDSWTLHILSHDRVPFPLRIWKTLGNDAVMYVYDFYEVEDLCEKELFRLGDNLQLPFRAGCQLPLPKGMKPPTLASKMSFVADLDDEEILATKEWYDTTARVFRCDEIFTDAPTTIQDDQHGLVYKIAQTCVAKPNEMAVGKLVADGSTCSGAIAVQAFTLQNKYYIGETTVRGIPVDVWEAVGDETTIATVARFFVTKPNVTMNINEQVESQVPVRVMARVPVDGGDKDSKEIIISDVEIFDYYSTENGVEFSKNFDISDCQKEYTYIQIVFQSNDEFNEELLLLSNAVEELSLKTREAILKSGELSMLQLPYIKLDVQDKRKVIATAKVLAGPNYIDPFTEREAKYGRYQEVTPIHSQSVDACAKQCIEKDCATMIHCPGDDCYIMKNSDESTWGKPVLEKECQAFDKAASAGKFTYRTLDEITKLIKTQALEGDAFKIKVMSEEGPFQFVPVEFQSQISQFNERGSEGPYRLQFDRQSISPSHKSSSVVDKVATAGECYRECINNNDIACTSFSVCRKQNQCVLSSLNINDGSTPDPEQKDALVKAASDCSVYSVRYLDQFEVLPGKVRSSGSIVSDDGKTAGDCARFCRQKDYEGLVSCHGFDFCPNDNKCFFYDSHYNEESSTADMTEKPACDHYALKFSADYTAVSKSILKVSGESTRSAVTLDQCAKMCSERSDGKCQTMAFCDDGKKTETSTQCHLYPVLPEDAPNEKSTDCTLYLKNPLVMDVIRPSRQEELTQSTLIQGMSNGGFATLLVFMMIFGLAIGIVGYLYHDRLLALVGRGGASAGGSSDGATITYNRQDNENAA